MPTTPRPFRLNDGTGERHLAVDSAHGFVEVLEVGPELAQLPGVEKLIHGRATQMNRLGGIVPRVFAVKRQGGRVFVTAEYCRGLRLSTLLAYMAARPGQVSDAAVLTVALAIVRALAVVHRQPDALVHGSICPDHVVLTSDGKALLTDAMLGPALASLELGRERLWKAFGLTMPSGAALPRFDQRADVTQAAGAILAMAVGRRMTDADFPRCVPELLASVMAPAEPARLEQASQFRAWLQRALQLPTRGVFSSGRDAEQALAGLVGNSSREGLAALRTLVEQLTVPDAATGGGQTAVGMGGIYSRSA